MAGPAFREVLPGSPGSREPPPFPEDPALAVFPAGSAASIALAVCALAALSVSVAPLLHGLPPWEEPSEAAGRLEELRGLLPPGETLGYLDDGGGGDRETAALYQTQYALAPVLVARGAYHPRVLGRFLLPPPASRIRDLGLVLERDLGDGLLLFRRRGP